jgi:voltage-gated potassium channel
MREEKPLPTVAPWRQKLWKIVFESDTRSGKAFDIALLLAILLSVGVVLLESTPGIDTNTLRIFIQLEILFTLLFTLEYLLRISIVRRPWRYIKSFYGVVDLMAILPTYISFFLPGAQYFLVVRILRLLRVFRILKLEKYLMHAEQLARALRSSRIKIGVFLFTIINIVVILGTAVYVIEGPANGFTSIPLSIYWAVVTMTTVGYGDLVPLTTTGRMLATVIMLIGYGIIAVPTGIVSAEIVRAQKQASDQKCPHCSRTGHEEDAQYCKYCGQGLKG